MSRVNILIVEDDHDISELLTTILQTMRCDERAIHVLAAADGIAAKEILEKVSVDLVILDLVLPRMSGMRVLEWAQQEKLDTNFLIVSGFLDHASDLPTTMPGRLEYLNKPISVAHIEMKVREMLPLRKRA